MVVLADSIGRMIPGEVASGITVSVLCRVRHSLQDARPEDFGGPGKNWGVALLRDDVSKADLFGSSVLPRASRNMPGWATTEWSWRLSATIG